ncbi:MAG TPA: KH domain-containing protein [Candidatus Saccharimonadales bacterium]|nr:KH domain-containing protein [Candidatus Saccharimonadales bacterium]
MAVSIDQQFIEYIVKSLVSNPDAVKIERRIDEKGVLLELTVDPEDLGRVIGKRGATAQSLRTLLRALGTKNDARYNLKIVDNGEPRPARQNDLAASDNAADEPATNDDAATSADEPAQQDDGEPEDVGRATNDDTVDHESDEDRPSASLADRTRAELADLDDLDV